MADSQHDAGHALLVVPAVNESLRVTITFQDICYNVENAGNEIIAD